MSESRTWYPNGIFPPPANVEVLSAEDWEEVQVTFKRHMQQDAPPRLREALNHALWIFASVDQGVQSGRDKGRRGQKFVSAPALPKQVRSNLERARRAALRLRSCIYDLDGNSKQLITEADHFGVQELFDLSGRAITIIAAAESRASQYPTSRAGIIDHASILMGSYLARTVCHFCGDEKLSATRDGLFHQLFLVLFRSLKKPDDDRIKTTRRAVERYKNNPEGGGTF